jgi:hypothetical protein
VDMLLDRASSCLKWEIGFASCIFGCRQKTGTPPSPSLTNSSVGVVCGRARMVSSRCVRNWHANPITPSRKQRSSARPSILTSRSPMVPKWTRRSLRVGWAPPTASQPRWAELTLRGTRAFVAQGIPRFHLGPERGLLRLFQTARSRSVTDVLPFVFLASAHLASIHRFQYA